MTTAPGPILVLISIIGLIMIAGTAYVSVVAAAAAAAS